MVRSQPIAVVGSGIVTAAGRGPVRTLAALTNASTVPSLPKTLQGDLAGAHPVFEVPDDALADFPGRLPGGRGRRSLRLAIVAATDAIRETVAAGPLRLSADRIAVIVGATVGGMNHTEEWIEDWCDASRPKPAAGAAASAAATAAAASAGRPSALPARPLARRSAIRHVVLWEMPNILASRFGLKGPAFAVSTACTSGAEAIAAAADLISSGACDAALAGGVDCLARLTYNGFAALGVMSQHRCSPFDGARSGLNLGEGAAFLMLVRADLAPDGGGPSGRFPVLAGWGSSTEGHPAPAPRPDGSGVAASVGEALRVAGVDPQDIGWFHAHGTATSTNDAVESLGIRKVFGSQRVPVSSTKHLFGHTQGAAGAVASVVALYAMSNHFAPGNARITTPDDACDVAVVPPGGLRIPLRRAMVNSLGFGGASCSLLFARAGL